MNKVKESVSKTFVVIKDKWTGISKRTRIISLAVAGVIIVAAVVLTIVLNSSGDYVVLCKAANEQEVTSIKAALASVGVADVEVERDFTVMVKKDVQIAAQMAIAEQGLPSPGAGYNNDVWDTGVGMFSTDTQMKEKQKQQLQSWISARLDTIPEVSRSMVTLTIPPKSNYVMVENVQVPRASVTLVLKTGQTLSNDQIKGIRSLVRNAVPDLEEEYIGVYDGNGTQLIPDDTGITAGESLELRRQRLSMEADFKELVINNAIKNLVPQLNLAVGEGKYALAVNVELDFTSDKEVVEEEYTPPEGLVDSGIARSITEKFAAGGTAAEAGPIGQAVDGDISPNYPTIPDVEMGEEFYSEMGREVYYEINKRLMTYKDDGLREARRTASLFIDGEGNMTDADREAWVAIIRTATGATEVTVMERPFPPQPTVGLKNRASKSPAQLAKDILIYIMIILGAVLIVLFAMAFLATGSKKKRLIRNRSIAVSADAAGAYVKDDVFLPPIESDDFDLPSLLEDNDTKDVVLKREIREFSKSNPEIIAQLIRTWLREDD